MVSDFLIRSVRIYPHIYIPVWFDEFGIKKLKTMIMTIINITSPLSQTAVYVLNTINKPDKWKFKLYDCLKSHSWIWKSFITFPFKIFLS